MDYPTIRAGVVILIQAIIGYILYRRGVQWIKRFARPTADAYSEGHDSGYDKGWREGREANTLRLVRMRKKRGNGDALG